ncbi:MAG: hypothetical protein M0P49_07645 [Bacilli bacterium]|nr:hypothetical protein [Bacilli bacterium]
MDSLEKWKYSKWRYTTMRDLLNEFRKGMFDNGNEVLGIPSCIFCSSGCDDCEWKNVFNLCKHKGGPGNEDYDIFSQGIKDAMYGLNNIIFKIGGEINKLERK